MSGPAQVRLAGEILLTYATARWHLRRLPLPEVVNRLRGVDASHHDPPGAAQSVRLGRAVSRTLARLPTDTRCLLRSLVLLRILARRGGRPALVIAARPGERMQLDAHAWVEVEGHPVLPPASSDYGRLVTL